MIFAIVAAAGKGRRFGSAKQLVTILGRPVLCWCLQALQSAGLISHTIVVYPPDEEEITYQQILQHQTSLPIKFVRGGENRFDSVRNGFAAITGASSEDLVLIHDAARPVVSSGLIRAVIEATQTKGAVVPVLPALDTIKEIKGALVTRTVPRENLALVQTPQGFRYDLLQKAYLIADHSGESTAYTDEAMLVEKAGFDVYCIAGEKQNIKLTDREDIAFLEYYLSRR